MDVLAMAGKGSPVLCGGLYASGTDNAVNTPSQGRGVADVRAVGCALASMWSKNGVEHREGTKNPKASRPRSVRPRFVGAVIVGFFGRFVNCNLAESYYFIEVLLGGPIWRLRLAKD